ncbi:unnamed protein product [Ceratitis capitata]|uniref:(Mediterranean fruit fly) hypothetical protein n=1 Tax=Ceratitis capitata TaxID=7213 RepID=A0A811UWA0_CERCA|nr:unnamed protein product [Ceratitis capitata]
MDRHKLKCIAINVNSLISKQKRHYFNLFLQKHKPDVVLAAELRLSDKHNISFRNYSYVPQLMKTHTDNKNSQSTGIFIRENFQYNRIEVERTTYLETTAIELLTSDGNRIAIAAMYNRLSKTDKLCTSDLLKVLNALSARTNEIILGGDLNARHPSWGDNCTNTNGRVLFNWLSECPLLKVLPTANPTRTSGGCNSFIDLFIVSPFVTVCFDNDSEHYCKLRTHYFESDHRAIELCLDRSQNDILRQPPRKIIDYKNINSDELNQQLSAMLKNNCLALDRVASTTEIDNCISHLNVAWEKVINSEAVPKIEIRSKGLISLPSIILDFIKEKKNCVGQCSDVQIQDAKKYL